MRSQLRLVGHNLNSRTVNKSPFHDLVPHLKQAVFLSTFHNNGEQPKCQSEVDSLEKPIDKGGSKGTEAKREKVLNIEKAGAVGATDSLSNSFNHPVKISHSCSIDLNLKRTGNRKSKWWFNGVKVVNALELTTLVYSYITFTSKRNKRKLVIIHKEQNIDKVNGLVWWLSTFSHIHLFFSSIPRKPSLVESVNFPAEEIKGHWCLKMCSLRCVLMGS